MLLQCISESFQTAPLRVFLASRDIRQGDPPSPFLFTMVADAFSFLIIGSYKQTLHGFQIGEKLGVHLHVQGEIVLFVDADQAGLHNLKNFIVSFEMVSNMKINWHSSAFQRCKYQTMKGEVWQGSLGARGRNGQFSIRD